MATTQPNSRGFTLIELILVMAMLLTVPLNLVPILLLAGVLLGAMLNASSARFTYRIALEAIAAWHCMGPVLVLAAFGNPSPSLSLNAPLQ